MKAVWRRSLLPLLLLAWPLLADFSGRVVAVADGDTITVRTDDQRTVKVRLNGIDCPEKGQAFGKHAKEFTSRHAFGKRVTIKEHGGDRYGRVIGDVVLGDGRLLNAELIRAGLAWHYKEYSTDPYLAKLEKEARVARVGLWSDPKAVSPWVFRRGERANRGALPAPVEPKAHPTSTALSLSGQNELLHGNRGSRVFHGPRCPNYRCSNCSVEFATRAEAEASGYRPAGCCFPR
jgi:micrococcal nuclease